MVLQVVRLDPKSNIALLRALDVEVAVEQVLALSDSGRKY